MQQLTPQEQIERQITAAAFRKGLADEDVKAEFEALCRQVELERQRFLAEGRVDTEWLDCRLRDLRNAQARLETATTELNHWTRTRELLCASA